MRKLKFVVGGRHLLGVFALALLAVMLFAAQDNKANFSAWSAPINLGPVVNSHSYDGCVTISKSGLSLYFRSDRPGGEGDFDIWVSQRDSLEDPWGFPVNLGPTINGPYGEYCTTFSVDGHWMIFVSTRPGGSGSQDLWISHRTDKLDDFGWQTPKNLGPIVNSFAQENGPCLVDDEATGQTLLYFSSNRPGGRGGLDIYVSTAISADVFGPPTLVAELSTRFIDYQPVVRKDGLEVIFASNRPGSLPKSAALVFPDLWVSTRESTLDPWSPPVSLGPLVNSDAYEFHPTLSWDGTTLIFPSEREGGKVGWADLFMCTRTKL
jgi:Tol biopolymer transport system component